MKNNNILSWVCSGITIALSTQVTDILQIILAILGAISALISLAFNIYCWYKKATADGKIDKEEVDELVDIVKEGTEDGKTKR